MEQPFSTSKVTVEYFDPHDVFKLLAPGLVPRLPLRNLHWQSHAGPLRSIDTLHIELVPAGDKNSVTSPLSSPPSSQQLDRVISRDDGFQTQIGATLSSDAIDQTTNRNSTPARRHQIPGLRRTPYLKVLLVRCDDNDSYKSHVRQEIRDWVKANTPTSGSKRNTAENHDAFEWLIIHLVIPNTAAATQPRDSGSATEKSSTTSRWRPGSSTLLEKMKSDFNTSSKGVADRIAQIRIGVNDVPYDSLPRVVPAVPSGYTETEQETENSWTDLVSKFRSLILSSFDMRVSQYEDDIKEKDSQRSLPGWNFCTFFILKEGLARGFESVGLVEDALVGYDELSVGLDMIVKEQSSTEPRSATNALLSYTDELKQIALKARSAIIGTGDEDDDEMVDLQQSPQAEDAIPQNPYDDIPISSTKKPYRDLIVANNVSVFDFRCYIFSRQIALLLRLGNAWSTREELLAKLKEQQESIIHGVAPRAPPPRQKENEHEDLTMLAEICRRTLEFIPALSQVMRNDVLAALTEMAKADENAETTTAQADPLLSEVVDNLVASFAFSIAQQILAQTSTKALPIPETVLSPEGDHEPKSAIPEPKTMMHPARSSSLAIRTGGGAGVTRPPPSPNVFPGRHDPQDGGMQSPFLKAGLEELAARRAELYIVSRNILAECGKKRGWSDGWANVSVVGESTIVDMVEIDLDDDEKSDTSNEQVATSNEPVVSISGIDSKLLKTALDNSTDFYRLYETLTDKALRHYTVADHTHSVHTSMADIAVLKYHLGDYASASGFFWRTTPFFGESGWSLLELSMLVMYSRCLEQLQRKEEYVKVMLKLLTKAASAERDRQEKKSAFGRGGKDDNEYPDNDAIKGFLNDLLAVTKTLPSELRIPLSSFFYMAQVDGPPEYDQGRDGISLNLKVNSLLVDSLKIDSAKVRIATATGKPAKEIWFELAEPVTVKPGRSKLKLHSNRTIPGSYEIDEIDFTASNLRLHHEREVGQPLDKSSDIIRSPNVVIFHRTDTLDVQLYASRHIQLDRNNTIDIELNSGWNDLVSAEIRVKAATGGLRLLTSEAKCIGSVEFSKPPEAGLFCLDSVPQNEKVRIRFPYTVEQETPSISVRIDVSYKTEHGTFFFSRTPIIRTALALGVNVQDVFKHEALFSRFTVSTADHSPLRLFKSELVASDVFESDFGLPPNGPVVIFPKQPASLVYKISRKKGVPVEPKMQKTMYLRLLYSVLEDEIASLIEESLTSSLQDTPLRPFSRLLCSTVVSYLRRELATNDLERTALLGSVPTAFLSSVNWAKHFGGLGKTPDDSDYAHVLSSFLSTWVSENSKLTLETSMAAEPRSILIPVDIPSLTIIHTADIRLQQQPSQTSLSPVDALTPTVCTNQLLPAVLHLKWTRMWDTTTPPRDHADIEFSYELTAPSDTWLIGGRRKGHFVIPAPSPSNENDDQEYSSSTPSTEAAIPILLIPLRDGWLPYPGVDIREVRTDTPATTNHGHNQRSSVIVAESSVQFETDLRNLGETVRVVADRKRVTLSLDASGPGGGPLVLDVEGRGVDGVRVVA